MCVRGEVNVSLQNGAYIIHSLNFQVENYLMLSEFENNLIAEMPVIMDRKGRRWSLARQAEEETSRGGKWRLVPGPNRLITVIDEASV